MAEFYDARRVPRKVSRESAVFRVAQDLSSRLGIAAGLIRPDDFRRSRRPELGPFEHDLHLFLRRFTIDRSLAGTPSEHRQRVAAMVAARSERAA